MIQIGISDSDLQHRYRSVTRRGERAPDGDHARTNRLVARLLGQDATVLAALVLVALVLAAGLSARFGMPGALTLAAMSILWLVVNKPMEGPVLVVVVRGHGLTGGDLAGLAGLGLAMFLGARARREHLRA
jgi:hypothetical protein